MDAPQTAEWGPALWGILHMLAEKSGRGTGVVRQMGRGPAQLCHADERRLWANVITALRTSLPCPVCKQHYLEYIRANPIDPVLRIPGPEWALALREWLWTFHNTVRSQKGQGAGLPLEQLATVYAPAGAQFVTWKQIVQEHMRRGMFFRWLAREDLLRALQAFDQLWLLTA